MDRYLLDTNTLSDAIRNPRGTVAQRITAAQRGTTCTSIIVAAELRFGALIRRSARLTARVDELLVTIDVLPFEAPADLVYAGIRAELESAGWPIGANDLLIAAHALALDLTLVSANEREFARVPGLRLQNWVT